MSCQRGCAVIKVEKDWFLLIAWCEHGDLTPNQANAYGPFVTQEDAEDYIDHFSNPGGVNVYKYAKLSDAPVNYQLLVKHNLTAPKQQNCYGGYYF